MRKVIKLTESDLKKLIGNIVSEQSTMDMNEYSEGFMNKIVNKFKQELTSEVEIYVNRFKEISKNLENRDISTYSFEQLKQTVDSYMNRFERDRLQGFEREMDKEVERSYGGANKGAQDGYRDYLTTRNADQLNSMKQSSFKDRLNEQVAPTQQNDGGKAFLIQVLTNKINQMSKEKDSATMVAQVVYNNAAHFMNKTDIFADQTKFGKPFSTNVPFAPR
jgi:galactitol-specific phosphotransferase system IIB component